MSLFRAEVELLGDSYNEVIERIEAMVEDEPVVVKLVYGAAEHYAGPSGVFCEGCEGGVFPGIRWPTQCNDDDSEDWVERCDTCERYDSDREAYTALTEIYRSAFDNIDDEVERGYAKPVGSMISQPFFNLQRTA